MNASFDIKRGQTTAIVGEGGSGKSLIPKLLLRVYDPQQGTITVNGHNLKDINIEDFRNIIGYINKDFIQVEGSFSKVARRLIRRDLSDRELSDVFVFAELDDFLESINSSIHHDSLSLFEKFKITLGLNVLKNPQMFVFDKATIGMDVLHEKKVFQLIQKLTSMKNTVVVIPHRLILNEEDNIILLKKGSVIAKGSHYELLQTQDEYKAYYEMQVEAMKEIKHHGLKKDLKFDFAYENSDEDEENSALLDKTRIIEKVNKERDNSIPNENLPSIDSNILRNILPKRKSILVLTLLIVALGMTVPSVLVIISM